MNHPHKSLFFHLLIGMAFVLQQVGVKGDADSMTTLSTKISNSSSENEIETQGMITTFATTALNSDAYLLSLTTSVSTSSSSVELSSLVLSTFPTQSTITSALTAINPSFSAPIQSQVTPSSTIPPIATPDSGSLVPTMSTVSNRGIKSSSLPLVTVNVTQKATPSSASMRISETSASQDGSNSTTPAITSPKTTSQSSASITSATPPLSPSSRFSSTLQRSVSAFISPRISLSMSTGNQEESSTVARSTGQVTTAKHQSVPSTTGLISISETAFVVSSATVTLSSIVGSITALSVSRLNTTTASIMTSRVVSSTWNTYSQGPLVNSSATGRSVSVMSTVPPQPTTDTKITTVPPTKRPFTANCWGGGCSSAVGLGEFSYLVTSPLILSLLYSID